MLFRSGAILMGLVLLLVRVLPRDGGSWADLGLLVLGMFLAVVTGVVVWVAGLARAARRLFDAGRRLGAVIAAVAAVFVLALAWSVLAGVLDDGAGLPRAASGALASLGVLLALAVPSVVFRLWDRRAISP